MPRKANNALARQKMAKNTPVTLEIMENYLEPHFTAIQEDASNLREELMSGIGLLRHEVKSDIGKLSQDIGLLGLDINKKHETNLRAILEILTVHKKEIRSVKEDNWSLDKRVTKLEKQLA